MLIWTEEERRTDEPQWSHLRQEVPNLPPAKATPFIGEVGGPQSYVTWAIETFERNGSRLTITVHPHLLASLPTLIAAPPPSPVGSTEAPSVSEERRSGSPCGIDRRTCASEPVRPPSLVLMKDQVGPLRVH